MTTVAYVSFCEVAPRTCPRPNRLSGLARIAACSKRRVTSGLGVRLWTESDRIDFDARFDAATAICRVGEEFDLVVRPRSSYAWGGRYRVHVTRGPVRPRDLCVAARVRDRLVLLMRRAGFCVEYEGDRGEQLFAKAIGKRVNHGRNDQVRARSARSVSGYLSNLSMRGEY